MHPFVSFFALFFLFSVHPAQDRPTPKVLDLWATWYYAPTLAHAPAGIDLLDREQKPTGFRLNACDWCHAAVEGTVFLEKENKTWVLNYAGRSKDLLNDCRECEAYKNYDGYAKTGRVLWTLSDGFGLGVKDYKLQPFKSIAVDPGVIPFGSVIYIPDAEGILYENAAGDTLAHDGLFFAADTGSKIKGNHIDVYLGKQTVNPFAFIHSKASATFKAYLISDNDTRENLELQHR